MRILGLDHVSVTTTDIERSLAFYQDLLGIPVSSVGEVSGAEVDRLTGVPGVRMLIADLDLGGGQVLELIEYVGGEDGTPLPLAHPGSGHIGLSVEDLDDLHARLVRSNAAVRSEPVELSEPGVWHVVRCLTVLDPDGVAVELVERPRSTLTGEDVAAEVTRADP